MRTREGVRDNHPRRPARPTTREDQLSTPPEAVPTAPDAHAAQPPAARYGRRTPPRVVRRRLVVAFAVFALVFAGFAAWAVQARHAGGLRWQDVASEIDGDAQVRVTFDITLPVGTTGVCTLQARNIGFAEVGRIDAPVGPFTTATTRVTVRMPTTELAVEGHVEACALR